MANLQFKQWMCSDTEPSFTQETGLQRLLAFAGIHSTASRSLVPDQAGAYNWREDYQGDVSIDSIGYTLGGIDNGVWNKVFLTADVSYGFTADFDKEGTIGGFLFGGKVGSWRCYLVWWTASRVGLSLLDGTNGYTETPLLSLPFSAIDVAHVQVAVKGISSTAIDQVDDLLITLRLGDRVIFSYAMQLDTAIGDQIGFAVQGNNTARFENLRVPQFHQIIEIASVGPTEKTAAGVGRITGMEMIRLQARFDGSVLIWRNDLSNSVSTIESGDYKTLTVKEDLLSPTHFRLTGGLYEADVYAGLDDATGVVQHRGHIFVTANDPNALVERDTFDRAKRKARETVEAANAIEIDVPFRPLLEAEDVIGVVFPYCTTPVLYRVTTIDFKSSSTKDATQFESKLSCRRLTSGF